jgi:hypothetical protein
MPMMILIRRPYRSMTCCDGMALTNPAMYIEVVIRPRDSELGLPMAATRTYQWGLAEDLRLWETDLSSKQA